MLQTLIGLILLLSPFLLIFKYKDKKEGFVNVLSFLIVFHLSIALVTQALHIFTYPIILGINPLVLLVVIINIPYRRLPPTLALRRTRKSATPSGIANFSSRFRRIDPLRFFKKSNRASWVFIFVILVAFICLFSIHYDYSGKITTATSSAYQEVKHMEYPYPYFSDEWYNIALIKDSIKSHRLPFKNPLTPEGQPFVNFELAFHSFFSELFLLLNLDPLTNYTILAIFFNLLIVSLVYVFLRVSKVSQLPAGITSLALLYITNGANLPGLWNLLSLNLGIICLLLSFFFISTKKTKMVFLTTITALLFYPPLVPFSGLAIIFYIISKKQSSRIQNVY